MAGQGILAAVTLIIVLAFAVVRPRGLPEATAAVPGAILVLITGGIHLGTAWAEVQTLLPVVGFLAAILVLSELCARDGLFQWAGQFMARRSRGEPQRLLVLVFGAAAITTAVLSLDATVVLLTPVVFATAARVGVKAKPHVYACTHLANSSSLLFPVSNLTNLLAMTALGISFIQFGMLMVLPWLVVIGVEYIAFRFYFARDLSISAGPSLPKAEDVELPRFSATIVMLTLAGFIVASFFGIDVVWVALVGAAIIAVRSLLIKQAQVNTLVKSLNFPFIAFVLSLGIIVKALVDNGLADIMANIVPSGNSLYALLAWAGLAAILANLVNNLPAILIMLPLAVSGHVGPALAVLIGVNVGPNMTYVGSLATLLWRKIMRAHDHDAPLGEFTWLGLLTTPVAIGLGVVALWVSVNLFGGAL